MPPSFSARLGSSRRSSQPPPSPQVNGNITDVVAAFRSAIDSIVEPAISRLIAHERKRGSSEDCFQSTAGSYLRFRCCVYFTTLAAGLLEQSFSSPPVASSLSSSSGIATQSPYGPMARWLLPPYSSGAPLLPEVSARLEQLVSEADGAGEYYDVSDLRAAAAQLPGPVGRYSAPLVVRGVVGTLWRCEVTTAHTYLVFRAASAAGAMEDVYIDVTFKQFLVMPEWLDPPHFEACRDEGLFADLPDTFVGTPAELAQLLTLPGLEAAHKAIFERADVPPPEQASRPEALAQMHTLRNDVMFALHDAQRRSMQCGRPTQS